jgi:hypothetical protein
LVREGNRACVMLAHSVGVDVGTDRSISAGPVAVSIRPEQLCFVSEGGMSGIVKAVMPLGANVVYEIEVAPGLALKISQAREGKAVTHQIGELVSIAPRSVDACHVFPVS